MVGVFVIVVGGIGRFGKASDKSTDIGIIVEEILVAVEDEDGNLDPVGTAIHTINQVRERAKEAEGVFFDVVGIGFGLFVVESGLGNLHGFLAREGIDGYPGEGGGCACNLNQGNFPHFDVVSESDDGRGKDERVTGW